MRHFTSSIETIAESGLTAPFRGNRAPLDPTAAPDTRFLRRDYVLLPLLSLLTVLTLFAGTEIVTRAFWWSEDRGYCMYFDRLVGPHGKPDCTSVEKIPEAPAAVTEHFNHCGYRSQASCGPKVPGTYRIAVLGSSIAEGYMIPYNEMLTARMTNALSRDWGRKVEFENLAAEACPPIYSYRHLHEALALHPDAIVLVLNPWDLEQDVDPALLAMRDNPNPIDRVPAPVVNLSPLQHIQALAHDSRSMLVAQHYLLQNQNTFLKLYVMAGGDHTSFVRYPFDSAWSRRFAVTDLLLGEMASQIRAAGSAFLVLAVPERAQLLMLRRHDLPPGVDPSAFTRQLATTAQKHGILFVDGLKVLAKAPDPEQLFYVVDGHATPLAHRLLGQSVASELERSASHKS